MQSEKNNEQDTDQAQANFRESLIQKSIRAAKWNYLGVIARVFIQLVAQIVLARLVGPAEFGYYTFVFMAVGIFYLLAELGLSSALVQSKTLSDSDISSAWSRLLISSTVASTILITFADSIAATFGLPEAGAYLQLAAIPLVFQLLSSIALALLRKNLDFKRIQFAQVTGMAIGQLGVGLILAWLFHSAWAILTGWIVQLLIAWTIMYWKVQHTLAPSFSRQQHSLAIFGLSAWAANIANWLIENLHMVFAAKLFSASTLGLYSVSSNLVRYPTNHLVSTLQSVIFPASAAAQGDLQAIKSGYLATVSLITLITFPAFLSISALSEQLVLLLYGSSWHAAAELIKPLALAMPLHAITAVSGPILWGIGQVKRESVLQWITLLFFSFLIMLTGTITPLMLAWIVLATYTLRAMLIAVYVAFALKISLKQMITTLRGPVLLGLLAYPIGFIYQKYLIDQPPLLTIMASTLTTISLSSMIFWIAPASLINPLLAKAMVLLGSKLPSVVQKKLRSVYPSIKPD